MTDAERQFRAAEARRLLNEPLLKEAFEDLANSAIEELLAIRGAEPEDDRKRRALCDRINVIRDFQGTLARIIAEGSRISGRASA